MPDNNILQQIELTRTNGGFERITERIVRETALTISANGKAYATAMIMAGMEREFTVGHLFTQRIISGTADIASITVTGTTAEVILTNDTEKPDPEPGPVESDLVVGRHDIFTCVKAILKSEVFAETEAVHSAGLFMEGNKPVAIAEDLGRHHALDKAIGAALLKGIDLTRTLAASTGRQPAEMIYKCRNAGIPIVVTKGTPTTLAVELAKKNDIAIAGLVRGAKMFVYSHSERIR